ncbi:MAG: hypothetical protein ACSHX3_05665 [Litorimonas sp.]
MSEQPKIQDVSISDLMEDILGFGARTFRSIQATFMSPRRYFEAAKQPDWGGIFSPSVRIYLGLIAISAVFRFAFTGENGVMTTLYEQQFIQMFDQIEIDQGRRPEITEKEMAMNVLRYYFPLTPFIALPLFMVVGFMFRSFGEPLNAVVRIRYVFACMIPATLTMTVFSLSMALLPSTLTERLSLVGLGLTLILVYITAYRGAFSAEMTSRAAKFGRAIGLSALILVAMMLASIIALMVAIIIAFHQAAKAGLL